jgi:hypothetical protein
MGHNPRDSNVQFVCQNTFCFINKFNPKYFFRSIVLITVYLFIFSGCKMLCLAALFP